MEKKQHNFGSLCLTRTFLDKPAALKGCYSTQVHIDGWMDSTVGSTWQLIAQTSSATLANTSEEFEFVFLLAYHPGSHSKMFFHWARVLSKVESTIYYTLLTWFSNSVKKNATNLFKLNCRTSYAAAIFNLRKRAAAYFFPSIELYAFFMVHFTLKMKYTLLLKIQNKGMCMDTDTDPFLGSWTDVDFERVSVPSSHRFICLIPCHHPYNRN